MSFSHTTAKCIELKIMSKFNSRKVKRDFNDVGLETYVRHRPSRRAKKAKLFESQIEFQIGPKSEEIEFQVGSRSMIPESEVLMHLNFDSNKGHHQEVYPTGIKLGKVLLPFPEKGPWRDLLHESKPVRNVKDGIINWDYQVLFKQGFSVDLDWRKLGIWSLPADCPSSQRHAARAWREIVDVLSFWTFKGKMLHHTDDVIKHMPLAEKFMVAPTLSGPIYDNLVLRNAFRSLLESHPTVTEQEVIQLIRAGDPSPCSDYGRTIIEWMTTRHVIEGACPHFKKNLSHLQVRFTARALQSACRKLVSVKGHRQRAQALKLFEKVHELNVQCVNEKPGDTKYTSNFAAYVKRKRMRNRDRKNLRLEKEGFAYQNDDRPAIHYSYAEYLEDEWMQEFDCDAHDVERLRTLMEAKYTLPDDYFKIETQNDPEPESPPDNRLKKAAEMFIPAVAASAVLMHCGIDPSTTGVLVFSAYVTYLMHMWNLYNVQAMGGAVSSIAPTIRAAGIGALRGATHYHATGEIVSLKKEVASALTDAIASSTDWAKQHGSRISVLLESMYGGTGEVFKIIKEHKITFSALRHLAFVTLWLFNRRGSKNKIMTDAMLGLYAYEAMPNLSEQSSAHEWWSQLLKLVSISSIPLTAVFPRNQLVKTLATSNVKRVQDNLGDVTETIVDLLPSIWSEHLTWMRDPIKAEVKALLQDPRVEKWVSNPDETQCEISGSDELALEVREYFRRLNAAHNKLGLRGYSNHAGVLKHTLAQMKPLNLEAGSRLVKGRRRRQPLGIRLTGAPGGGKSELAHILIKMCMEDIGVTYQEHNTYVMNQSDKYWDTFSEGEKKAAIKKVRSDIADWLRKFPNTDALIIDDFESSMDQVKIGEVHALIIDLINVTPLPLVCAAVEKKGMKYFDAQLVIVTTNRPIGRKGERGISCEDAFHRRFPITAHIFKQYGFVPSKPGAKELGNYYVRLLNSFTGVVVGEAMTGEQFAEYVVQVNRHRSYFFEGDTTNPPPDDVLALYTMCNERGQERNKALFGDTLPDNPGPLVEQSSTLDEFQAEKLLARFATLILLHPKYEGANGEILDKLLAAIHEFLQTKTADELFEIDYSEFPRPMWIPYLKKHMPGFTMEELISAGIMPEEKMSEEQRLEYMESLEESIVTYSTAETARELGKYIPPGIPSFSPVSWSTWSKAMLAIAIIGGLYCMYRAYYKDVLSLQSDPYQQEPLRARKRHKIVFQNAVEKVQRNLIRLKTGNGTAHGIMIDSHHFITNKHAGMLGIDSVVVGDSVHEVVAERVKTWSDRDLMAYRLATAIPRMRDISSNFVSEDMFSKYFYKLQIFRKCYRGSVMTSARLTRRVSHSEGGASYFKGLLSEVPLNGDSGSMYVVDDPNNITGQVVLGIHTGVLKGTSTAIITKVTKEDVESFFLKRDRSSVVHATSSGGSPIVPEEQASDENELA